MSDIVLILILDTYRRLHVGNTWVADALTRKTAQGSALFDRNASKKATRLVSFSACVLSPSIIVLEYFLIHSWQNNIFSVPENKALHPSFLNIFYYHYLSVSSGKFLFHYLCAWLPNAAYQPVEEDESSDGGEDELSDVVEDQSDGFSADEKEDDGEDEIDDTEEIPLEPTMAAPLSAQVSPLTNLQVNVTLCGIV